MGMGPTPAEAARVRAAVLAKTSKVNLELKTPVILAEV